MGARDPDLHPRTPHPRPTGRSRPGSPPASHAHRSRPFQPAPPLPPAPAAPGARRGPGESGARCRGRSMGRFRGGLRCIKYLLLGFNLLFWVRPEPAGQLGGRGPQGGDRNRVGPWGKAGCSRGAKETKREGTDGGGKGREKLEPPELVRKEDTVPCFPERSHHPQWHRPAGGTRCGDPVDPFNPRAGALVAGASCSPLGTHTPFARCLLGVGAGGSPAARSGCREGNPYPAAAWGGAPSQECVDTPPGSGGLLGKYGQ